ncbi:pleiotropic drug resistance protein 3-like isoform X3 [Carex littledalei]|uniref:Pleiotropic drug resistance protein 3-like isoform X3 n=1 Tax=Carex littledalei TaxID=544730 RepID=A0A833R8B3_9POAL|nr:pleiotropic drug resistance protein 3-like isoform X3 [Carex littledalei]
MAEPGEIHHIGSFSLRRENSLWRQGGDDVFSRSSREEDDEEALRWAALEKLPTFDRLRTGILLTPEGRRTEVDIGKLGLDDGKALLDRLVHVVEEDQERFLLKLRDRIDRVGLDLPSIEVRFKNLSIEAEAYVGSRGLPTLINSTMNTIESFANALHIVPSRKRPLPILHDVSGIIKPRRMSLLLGPPGSGKTTLLLALAGKLDSDLKVSGKVTYNGHEMNEFVPERTAAYISQHDLHLGEMTVRETLEFSARYQGVGTRYNMITELARREKEANIKPDPDIDVFMKAFSTGGHKTNIVTDYIIKLLGLEVCADTMVGNDMIRGISGGQRKRVTSGEMMVGPSRVLFMDEISTGLDSSTTYQIVNALSRSIHILQGTAVISLLQPAPETYNLFDDIILISDGQIVYQGPREHVLEFFESMGFQCPERKGVADFLQEVTSRKDQQQYWARYDEPYRYVPVKAFSEAFNSFHVGRNIAHELSVPFDKSTSHPAALTTSRYGVSKKELLMTNIEREILLMKRNSFVYIFKSCQLIIMAFVASTVFLRTNMHHDSVTDGGIYMGALFFSIIMIMFNGFSELSMTITKLPVFFKQRDLLFYPAWTYTLPSWILKIPISFIEVGVWVFTIYYVIGFDPNVARLFKQYLILLGVNQMSSALFRLIGGIARNMIVANTFGSFALLIIMVLGGFILSRENIKKWWKWGYWISPLMYAQNGISTNEFLGHSWNKILPGSNETLGVQVLKSRENSTSTNAVILGNIMLPSAAFGKAQPIVSEEALKEKHANLTGEIIEGSSKGRSYSTSQRGDALRHNASTSVHDRGGEEIYVGPLGHHSSKLVQRNKALIQELSTPPPDSSDLNFNTKYSQPFFSQCLACLWKQRLSYWRNPPYTAVAIEIPYVFVQALVYGIIQIPVWWRWYVWICPVAWTLYGLVSSQFGDVQNTIEGDQTVAAFVRSYFGFHHDFLGVVAVMVAAFAVLFAFLFGFAIQRFNFQKR